MKKTTQLIIKQQGSLEQEKVYKNGAQKNVHAVIKNIPFQFELGSTTSSFDFHKAPPVEAKLLYDCLGGEKLVDFVKSSPMEYTCKINSKGDLVTIDMKLSVLSSQHEDMFFIVKFLLKGTDIAVLSDPIKVVSKPAQLKKNRDGMRRGTKRTFNDTLKESLARIEASQRDQQAMLGTLFQTIALGQLALPSQTQKTQLSPATQQSTTTQRPLKKPKLEVDLLPLPIKDESEASSPSKAELFHKHLRALIQTYHDLPQEDRAETVRKAVKSSTTQEVEQLSEVVDCLMLEGLKREIGTNVDTGSPYAGLADFVPSSSMMTDDEPGLGVLDSFCEEFMAPVLFQEDPSNSHLSRSPLKRNNRTAFVGVAPSDVNHTVCAISNSHLPSTPTQTDSCGDKDTPSAGLSRARRFKEKYTTCSQTPLLNRIKKEKN